MQSISFDQLTPITWEDANNDGQFMLVRPTDKVTITNRKFFHQTLLDGKYIFVSAVDMDDPNLDDGKPQDFYLFENHAAEKTVLAPGEPGLKKYASRLLSNDETKDMVDDLVEEGYVIVSNMISLDDDMPYEPSFEEKVPVKFRDLQIIPTWEKADEIGEFVALRPDSPLLGRKRFDKIELNAPYMFYAAGLFQDFDPEGEDIQIAPGPSYFLFKDPLNKKGFDIYREIEHAEPLPHEEVKAMVEDLLDDGYVLARRTVPDLFPEEEEEEKIRPPSKALIPLQFEDLTLLKSWQEAKENPEFILVRPEDPVVGRPHADNDKIIDVNGAYSFYSYGIWFDEDDETKPRYYQFNDDVKEDIDINSEVKAMKKYGMKPLSYAKTQKMVEQLVKKGYVIALNYVEASSPPAKNVSPVPSPVKKASKEKARFAPKMRLLYNLYDFQQEPSRVEAVNKMIEYGALGFLDPYSFELISIPKVKEIYITGKLDVQFKELTYTDNVLLNCLEAGQFADYGAIVPDNQYQAVLAAIPEENRTDFENGADSIKIQDVLAKDTYELLKNYVKYEIWWSTPSFVRELELRHGFPLTGNVVNFARSFVNSESAALKKSDMVTINGLLGKSIPFDADVLLEDNFKVIDLDLSNCVTPTALDNALYLIANKDELSNKEMMDCFSALLEIGGYHRYLTVEQAIPAYFRKDNADNLSFWKKYITTIFRNGDSASISDCCRTYKKVVSQFEDDELFALFMKRGHRIYNFFFGKPEFYFGREIGNVSNRVIAECIPYLKDDASIEKYFDQEEYPDLQNREHIQLMIESALRISEDSYHYFIHKARRMEIDIASFYHTALRDGFHGSLEMLHRAYGGVRVDVNLLELNDVEKIRFCLTNLYGFGVQDLIDYICTRYRGVSWIRLLELVKFNHEEVINLCLSKQNPLTAIAIAVM